MKFSLPVGDRDELFIRTSRTAIGFTWTVHSDIGEGYYCFYRDVPYGWIGVPSLLLSLILFFGNPRKRNPQSVEPASPTGIKTELEPIEAAMTRTLWNSLQCHIAVIILCVIFNLMGGALPIYQGFIGNVISLMPLALFPTFYFCPLVSLWAASFLPGWKSFLVVMLIEVELCMLQQFTFPAGMT